MAQMTKRLPLLLDDVRAGMSLAAPVKRGQGEILLAQVVALTGALLQALRRKGVTTLSVLVRDTGRLVMATQFTVEYDQAIGYRLAPDCSAVAAEAVCRGLDHAAVGESLAQHWKFPVAMKKAIGQHHQRTKGSPLGLVVHSADAIAHALDLSGLGCRTPRYCVCSKYARRTQRPHVWFCQRKKEVTL